MDTISYSAARSQLASTMKRVCEDHEPIIITRQKEDSVVMISLDDFNALEETSYLLRVAKNARRLLESLAEFEKGGGTERTLAR
jgi:antitoxin YefM